MTREITIAIAQPQISADVRENSTSTIKMMTEAQQAGARLIHFPEGSLSGYCSTQVSDWADVDWEFLQNELETVCAHAKKLGIWVVLGCNHAIGEDYRPFNSLHVISDAGALKARYDKRFCSHNEITNWYSAGSDPVAFEVDGFRFGCALCIEVQFPELFREYGDLDVDAVLFSAYAKDQMFWIQAQGHAASNNYWVSVSVPAQNMSSLASGLIGPNGHRVAALEATATPDLLIVELDRRDEAFQVALAKARPWRRKARLGTIYDPKIKKRSEQ